ncbi:dihydrofolate reductase [Cytophaga hutchinsonii]|uniref:Dihydrofolate reductase n=1 Tax=Cytophaga hutchinsonii (strain ATCC 33406 / DSM 1761 / CIP 103989 / NBRC 15051 / NCIMB 9469 / D465) TaxID=269798 RepID=A0A6N4SR77_CYTH3|nr:dihydrofolate reductase [Cytophaga hutchinsonii]ABG58840.1 dihydrofolate reductase [Cytophaga hutchinsonii ATCC 33406]SFX80386.1 dihydrofolate reductase [Cytophaga hutchinsonii ATCC 33406]
MIRSIIVAQSENRAIGINNTLPWHLPADLKRFKAITMGHHMIMGRKTYESIGNPLPGRTSIVVTRNKDLVFAGCTMAHSLAEAFEIAQNNNDSEAFVIGGAELIKEAINSCDKLYLTTIHQNFEGDTFLDALASDWKETEHVVHAPDDKNAYSYSFITYEK